MESLEACAGPPAIYLVQRLSREFGGYIQWVGILPSKDVDFVLQNK